MVTLIALMGPPSAHARPPRHAQAPSVEARSRAHRTSVAQHSTRPSHTAGWAPGRALAPGTYTQNLPWRQPPPESILSCLDAVLSWECRWMSSAVLDNFLTQFSAGRRRLSHQGLISDHICHVLPYCQCKSLPRVNMT